MRHARDAAMITDNEKFIGFNLGADYCAEHEWGIKGIRNGFKIEPERLGIDGRSIRVSPDTILFKKVKYDKITGYILLYCPKYQFEYVGKLDKDGLGNLELYSWDLTSHDISTSWDDKSFAILVTEKYKTELEDLYNALKSCDAIIFVGSSKVFQNGGLNVFIKSRVPKSVADEWLAKDLDAVELNIRARATGIYERLKAAGKQYFALSPRWKDEKRGEVIFWLNPMKQDENNFGWFTVKDLDDWIAGKGKIPKGENN